MKVFVVGNGGREHALAWKLAQSPLVTDVYCAPGNGGTLRELKVHNVEISPLDFEKLSEFAITHQIQFTVVGPEEPLAKGIVDYFEAKNLAILGPSQYCAQLEASKAFAKSFMQENHIPTAAAATFTSLPEALHYLKSQTYPLVIKADGLAAGKGVIIADNQAVAEQTLKEMLQANRFGDAGSKVIIEEFIHGEEVSFIVLADLKTALPLATSQDHKARDEGDTGPNTGGMGAYSPAPRVTPELHQKIMNTVIQPTLDAMAKQGHPYRGFLYAGLMITPNHDIKVLEFNCRFGDPETQPILMRLKSDFCQMCLDALEGKLNFHTPEWDSRPALGVVMAAQGYPFDYRKNIPLSVINNLAASKQFKVFHAGTQFQKGSLVSQGGRVLCVTALGETLESAQSKAYQVIKKIDVPDLFYRHDIGHRALNKDPK